MSENTSPQTFLAGVDYSGIPGSELSRVITDPYTDQHDPMYDDPAYLAYEEEQQRRHDEGRDYPIGDKLLCYQCKPVTGVERVCTGVGPVVNRADPTQTYVLACGHVTI